MGLDGQCVRQRGTLHTRPCTARRPPRAQAGVSKQAVDFQSTSPLCERPLLTATRCLPCPALPCPACSALPALPCPVERHTNNIVLILFTMLRFSPIAHCPLRRHQKLWEAARDGQCDEWELEGPKYILALIIILDQFSRIFIPANDGLRYIGCVLFMYMDCTSLRISVPTHTHPPTHMHFKPRVCSTRRSIPPSASSQVCTQHPNLYTC